MNDYENLYHCNQCRTVRVLEQDSHKIMDKCTACGWHGSHFRVDLETEAPI